MKIKNIILVGTLAFTTLVGCEDANKKTETNEKVFFSENDMKQAKNIIEKVFYTYENHQKQLTMDEFEEANKSIAHDISEQLKDAYFDDVEVNIVNNHHERSGKDDFLEDPNNCYKKEEGAMLGTYDPECFLTYKFEGNKVKLQSPKIVYYKNINVHELIIPMTYEGKDLILPSFHFVKTKEGMKLIQGLGISSTILNDFKTLEDKTEEELKIEKQSKTLKEIKMYNIF
ncbi:hypothetical protein [Bacillus thuringiensis]|uniref:hypothetical protein n=1 Tax=Bacillus thuringiensis TaxID=1428 RepID=UPI000B450B14|nr:hypothetical protein [Bacillus thuringiensis]OUA30915.1 hypothetical protein BK777_00635 [Bacillus thuringiensis serovar aizawai]